MLISEVYRPSDVADLISHNTETYKGNFVEEKQCLMSTDTQDEGDLNP